ncbi:radixin-like [Rosa chinensis]|uniref:radixin-like n=1 Tax=Rosa chinensis TaxID=74649 RepID=UPI000D08E671|nr:radixin-like [Rosa chinensis]
MEIEKKGLEEKNKQIGETTGKREKKVDHINEKDRDVKEETDENRNSEKMETEIGKNDEEKNELQRKLERKEEELSALKKEVEEKEKEIGRINKEKGDVLEENMVLKIEKSSLNSRVKQLESIVMALTEKYESPIARPGDDNVSTPPPPPPSFLPPKSKASQDKPTDSKHSKNTKSQCGIQATQPQPTYSTASASEMTFTAPHSTDRGHQSPLQCLAQATAQIHSLTFPDVKLGTTEDACTANIA